MIWDCRAYEQVLCAAEGICDAQRCLLETCPCRVPGGQKAGRSSSTSSHGSCLVSRHLVATGLLWGMREALYVRARSSPLVSPLVCCKMPVARTTISPPNSLMLVRGWIPRHKCTHQCPLCHGKTSDIGGWELEPHAEDFNYLTKYCVQLRHQSLPFLRTLPVTSFYSWSLTIAASSSFGKEMYCETCLFHPAPELVAQSNQSSRDVWRDFQRCNWYVGVDFSFTNASERHLVVCAVGFITATRSRTLSSFWLHFENSFKQYLERINLQSDM